MAHTSQKVTIIGLGAVGRATAAAMVHRGSCQGLHLIDIQTDLIQSLAIDLTHAAALEKAPQVSVGAYDKIHESPLIIIDAGVNELDGGATDRKDPQGRLRLIDSNIPVMDAIAKEIQNKAQDAIIIVATNPPDPLADYVRANIPAKQVLSSGTFLDSMRLKVEVARVFNLPPTQIDAMVLGEHGTSSVIHWSGISVNGVAFIEAVKAQGFDLTETKTTIEQRVRGANLDIIQGLKASQYGVGAAVARLTEIIFNDEQITVPVGSLHEQDGISYSLPSVLGAGGVLNVAPPSLDEAEKAGLDNSVNALKKARERVMSLTK